MKTTFENTVELLEGEYELPVGYTDSEGNLHKKFTLREMTGEMEQALYSKKMRRNPAKMASELVYQVLNTLGDLSREEITRNMIESLYVMDIEYIILMNYFENIDDHIEEVATCPDCGEVNELKIDPLKIPVSFLPEGEEPVIEVNFPRPIEIKDGKKTDVLKFGLLDSRAQQLIFSKKDANVLEVTMTALSLTSLPAGDVGALEYRDLQKMRTKNRGKITEKLTETDLGIKTEVKVNCVECDFPIVTSFSTVSLMGN